MFTADTLLIRDLRVEEALDCVGFPITPSEGHEAPQKERKVAAAQSQKGFMNVFGRRKMEDTLI